MTTAPRIPADDSAIERILDEFETPPSERESSAADYREARAELAALRSRAVVETVMKPDETYVDAGKRHNETVIKTYLDTHEEREHACKIAAEIARDAAIEVSWEDVQMAVDQAMTGPWASYGFSLQVAEALTAIRRTRALKEKR